MMPGDNRKRAAEPPARRRADQQMTMDGCGALIGQHIARVESRTSASPGLDYLSLLKLSETLVLELDLDRLLEKLIRACVETAGAERAVLVLEGGILSGVNAALVGEGVIEGVVERSAALASRPAPLSVIEHLFASGEILVLGDAVRDARFGRDPFVSAHGVRSVLGVPIVRAKRTLAVLYLENNRSSDAFTDERVQMFRLLSGHLAIALENSILCEQRKEAQRQREERDRYLRLIFRHLPGTVWATDRDLRYTYATGRLFEAAGLDARKFPGTTVYDFLGTRAPAAPALAQHLAALAGEKQSFEYLYRDHWFAVFIDPLFDKKKHVIGCVGAAFDITDKRAAADHLARSERRFGEAQRVAHVGSFEWDIRANLVSWSDELHRIYGLEPGQFEGTFDAFLKRVHPDEVESTRKVVFDAYRKRAPFVYDHRIVRADGSIRILHTVGDVVKNEQGAPVRLVGTCWDVTELKESSTERESLLRKAQEALVARDEFLSIAAHEIRGPIHAINLSVQSLRRRKLPPEAVPKLFDVIERQDHRLSRFVDELLEVGRIRAGPLPMECEDVNLGEVVRQLATRLGPECARGGSSIKVTELQQVVGHWDRSRVEQVATNLVSNAIKFGLGRPIDITTDARGDRARLAIRDQGMGIAAEARDRIFEPFERAVSARNYGGLGLGLHIAKTIVEAMGGSLTVESEPGAGATFTVELPMRGR